jgi:hypothetical protein
LKVVLKIFSILTYDTFFCQSYWTTGGIKQAGTQNTSQSGRGAWFAFLAYPPHTDDTFLTSFLSIVFYTHFNRKIPKHFQD